MPQRCPSGEQLERFLAGQVPEARRRAIERHVEGCPACQQALEGLTRNRDAEGWRRLCQAPPEARALTDSDFLRRLRESPPPPETTSGTEPDAPEGTSSPGSNPPGEPAGFSAEWEERAAGQALAVAHRLVVPGYEILGVLGRGGMGIVYKARHVRLKRLVALKMALAGPHAGAAEQARFVAEAEAVARLQHPHIVQIHEIGEEGGRPYCALEYVAGGTLAQKLDGTPLPARIVAQLAEVLARAVHYAHRRGIVHRDLKPANVFLTPEGTPKIGDFGLAKRLEVAPGPTRPGAVMGTPSYMAPEQATGKSREIGPAADVYSLGAILYELLTGRPPFKGETELETLQQVAWVEPVPPRRLQPRVPRDLETVCLTCLHKEPRKRYPTAQALAEDLARFLTHRPIRARRTSFGELAWRWCRHNPALAAVSALAVAALVAVLVVSIAFGVYQGRAVTATQNALGEARDQRRQAEELAVGLAFDRGLALCDRGEVDEGLLWLAHGLELDDQTQGRDLRGAMRTALAGWEGHCHRLKACLEHDSPIGLVAFSPDGRLIAAGGGETVQLWRAADGAPLGPPIALQGPTVSALAFCPDGKRLLLGGWDGTARIWGVTDRQPAGPSLKHGKFIKAVAFPPPDFRAEKTGSTDLVLTGSADATVRLWDLTTGNEVWTSKTHTGTVNDLAFSPDGRFVLTGSADRTANVLDAQTGALLADPLKHGGAVNAVAVSREGTLLTGASDGKGRLWSRTGELLHDPLQHRKAVLAVAFSPDGRRVAIGGEDGALHLWDVASGRKLTWDISWQAMPPRVHRGRVLSVVFSPDGGAILTAGSDHTARLWEADTGRPLGGPLSHDNVVMKAIFSPDGRTLLTGSLDHTARLWERAIPTSTLSFSATAGEKGESPTPSPPPWRRGTRGEGTVPAFGHPGPAKPGRNVIKAALFSPTPAGQVILTGDENRTARLWDAATGRELGRLDHDGGVSAVAFSGDGRKVATASLDGTVRLCDAGALGRDAGLTLKHDGGVTAVAFAEGGKTVVTAGRDGTVRLWDAADGSPKQSLGSLPPVTELAVHPDGPTTACFGQGHKVYVWTPSAQTAGASEEKPLVLDAGCQPSTIALSPDGRTVVAAGHDGVLHFWDARTGARHAVQPPHAGLVVPRALVYSPDGSLLLTGGVGGKARLWDARTGAAVGSPMQHAAAVKAVAFSPDGRLLVTGSSDGTARLWEGRTGRPLGPPFSLPNSATVVAFSPDGGRFLVGCSDGSVRVWDVPRPMRGSPEEIRLRLQVDTGLELDAGRAARALTAAEWRERRRRLDDLGGLPER
jgi:WD40 repeat protein/tRNA A-37 threonylcarbamoyl transferase component Bud32